MKENVEGGVAISGISREASDELVAMGFREIPFCTLFFYIRTFCFQTVRYPYVLKILLR